MTDAAGSGSAGGATNRRKRLPYQYARGEKIGLPAEGPGSPATFGRRSAAFAIDAILSALIASVFVQADPELPGIAGRAPGWWSLIPLALMYIFGMLFAGRTIGQRMLGLRIIRVDRNAAVDPWRAILRTVLLILLIPALIVDRDGRGMHDRFTDTVVINA